MKRIVNLIQKELNQYWKYIEKAMKIDQKYDYVHIYQEEMISMIQSYEIESLQKPSLLQPDIVVSYYGYPYITIKVCMEAIQKQRNLILATENFCLAVNSVIVEIFQNIIKESNMNIAIKLKDSIGMTNWKTLQNEENQIVCIGNENTYFELLKNSIQADFVPFNNIQLYVSDPELEELKKTIYQACIKNYFDLEIFGEEDDLDEVINEMNEFAYTCVLLTRDDQMAQKFRNKISKKECFINQNPINFTKVKIPKNLF